MVRNNRSEIFHITWTPKVLLMYTRGTVRGLPKKYKIPNQSGMYLPKS